MKKKVSTMMNTNIIGRYDIENDVWYYGRYVGSKFEIISTVKF
jgi:hypothetical protein